MTNDPFGQMLKEVFMQDANRELDAQDAAHHHQQLLVMKDEEEAFERAYGDWCEFTKSRRTPCRARNQDWELIAVRLGSHVHDLYRRLK